jgi:hypothetical protein
MSRSLSHAKTHPFYPSFSIIVMCLLRWVVFQLCVRNKHLSNSDICGRTRSRTNSILERDGLPMLWMRLWARTRPKCKDALEIETCELCREPALPVLETELVFRDHKCGRKAPLICARNVALPLREPSRDALGLGRDEGENKRPTGSSRSRASSEPADPTPVVHPNSAVALAMMHDV